MQQNHRLFRCTWASFVCNQACVDLLGGFSVWEDFMLQSVAGLFTLLYGHTRDLPTVIVERRVRVRSPLALEFQEMHR